MTAADSMGFSGIYLSILLLAGVTIWAGFFMGFWKKPLPSGDGLRSWNLPTLDFAILLWLLFFWVFLSQVLAGKIMPMEEGEGPTPAFAILSGFLLQGGFILIFVLFQFYQPYASRLCLNVKSVSLGSAGVRALLYLLAAWPVFILAGILWKFLLEKLNPLVGDRFDFGPQEMISLFSEADLWPEKALLAVLAVGVAPIAEELVFRGALYRFLKRHTRLAMLLSSLFFALIHFHLLSFPSLVLVGLSLCWAYEITGNLRVPIIFHALFNLNTLILLSLR